MNNTLQYILNFKTNADSVASSIGNITASTISIDKAIMKVDNTFSNTYQNIQKKLSSVDLSAKIRNVQSAADGLSSLSEPGLQLSSSLAELSAITGVTGDKLKEIEGYARENSKVFGEDAAGSVESYKLVLSKLSPTIAQQPKALQAMGNSISTLSKTMGGDTLAATEVLTTAMNQYGVSTKDPMKASEEMAKIMNIMAAGAKEGSAELPQQKAALEQVGMAAKSANVSFAETISAIQVLDKAGKTGSEGGIALRNTLATLSQGRFLPPGVQKELVAAGVDISVLSDKTLSLSDRLKPLRKIMQDDALVTKLFGKENSNAAIALIQGIEEQERLTNAISNTNTAYEQAAVIMESPLEKNKRLTQQVNDFKISLFNATNGLLGYTKVISDVSLTMMNLAPIFGVVKGGLKSSIKMIGILTSKTKRQALWTNILSVKTKLVTTATKMWNVAKTVTIALTKKTINLFKKLNVKQTLLAAKTGLLTSAQWLLNVALNANPIGIVVVAVGALVGAIALVVAKYDEWGAVILALGGPFSWLVSSVVLVRRHWDSIVTAFKSDDITGGLKRIREVLFDVLLKPLAQIMGWVGELTDWDWAKNATKDINEYRKSLNLIEATKPENTFQKKERSSIFSGTGSISGLLSEKKYNVEVIENTDKDQTKPIPLGVNSIVSKNSPILLPEKPVGSEFTDINKNKNKNLTKETNSAITTGGQKTTNISLNINKEMIREVNITGKSFNESVVKMREMLEEELVKIFALASTL